MRIARSGIRTYTETDGLRDTRFGALFENQAGRLFAITGFGGDGGRKFLQGFDGKTFAAIPLCPNGISNLGWGSNQTGFEDHAGEWWVATAYGLCRFPHVARFEQLQHTRPKVIYSERDGLAGGFIFRVFEDHRGDIWISSTDGQSRNGLSRWQRSTGSLRHFSREPGFGDAMPPTAFREDRTGALWIGFYDGRVARYRDNHFLFLGTHDVVSGSDDFANGGLVGDIFADHAGRLWIGTSRGGLIRIDDPALDHSHVIAYTTAQGLSSNEVHCITEDLYGRLYIGTGRGLDRLNPGGVIEHFTTTDGLALGQPVAALRDRQGALWFGTTQGLSRWLPDPPQRNSPPPILIRGVRVRGIPQPIYELGESAVHKLVEALAKVLALPLPSLEDVGPSTLNIGQIHGGHAPNVIADKAEAQVLIRLVGDSAPVRAALVEAAAGLAEVDFTLEIPFVRLRAVEGLPTMIAKFTTDIPQLSNWGEPLLLGPGSIHVAHTPYEKLSKKELRESVDLYIQVAKQLLA